MIIGVDAAALGIKDDRLKVGVYQLARNLFEELEKQDRQNTYHLYTFYPIEKNLLKSFGKNVKNVVVKPVRGWTKIWLPLQLVKDKPDVFIGLNQSLPLTLPLQTYKTIVVIHDVLFEQYPKLYPGTYRKLHAETKAAALAADKIIVPSMATKKDIENFYKVSPKKITVIPEGVRAFARIKDKALIINKEPYFLFVGALKPQKNIPKLLEAFAQVKNPHLSPLPDKQGEENQGIKLFIVGGDMWMDKEIGKAFTNLPEKVQKRIMFLGNVDEATLANLYQNALAFVSPSLGEGFGLTFVEAMSFGIPIIGPHAGAVPEVVEKAGILVDPTNIKEITKAMEKMLDNTLRSNVAQKATVQAKKFTWEKFAKSFLHAIIS